MCWEEGEAGLDWSYEWFLEKTVQALFVVNWNLQIFVGCHWCHLQRPHLCCLLIELYIPSQSWSRISCPLTNNKFICLILKKSRFNCLMDAFYIFKDCRFKYCQIFLSIFIFFLYIVLLKGYFDERSLPGMFCSSFFWKTDVWSCFSWSQRRNTKSKRWERLIHF